nr:glycosyltransferase family 4 protein [Kiritimatiella glycovorans]
MFIWNFRPGPQGGAEHQCWKLARELVRQGVECTVLTRRSLLRSPRREETEGVHIRRIGLFGPLRTRMDRWRDRWRDRHGGDDGHTSSGTENVRAHGPLSLFRTIDYLCFLVSAYRYFEQHRKTIDLIHVHGEYWMAGFARHFGLKWRIPVLMKEALCPVFRPTNRDVPGWRRWERLRTNHWYAAMHAGIRSELMERGVPGDRIFDVPNGVDMPGERSALESPVALCASNFTQGAAHKGFDLLFRAWAGVAGTLDGVRLVIAGRGSMQAWRQYAEDTGCGDSIEFAGHVNDMDQIYLKAAVLLLPSRMEGISNTLLEAQSYGIPAVAFDLPGNRAVIEPGLNGEIVASEDHEAMAAAATRLLGDKRLRKRMGDAARERAEETFAMPVVASRMKTVYTDIIRKNDYEL